MPDSPHVLRARAATLRRHAIHLEGQPLAPVRSRAGRDTWIGPTALGFDEALTRAEQAVRQAALGLRARARRLESLADAAAATAVMQGPV